MSASELRSIVKAYDVRGVVPDQLDARTAWALGAAFADSVVLPDGAMGVVVGHDMRPSSPDLSRAFAEGVTSRGVRVVYLGLASTDQLYFASGAMGLPGAMFTASHNPAQYNGIKLCRSGARPVSLDTGLADVRDGAVALLESDAEPAASQAHIVPANLLADYGSFLRSLVDLRGARRLKVVVDAANGMAGMTVPAVLGSEAGLAPLPLDIVPLYFELDGTFPNHEANPLEPENLRDLQAAVVEHGADIGLAFDGDADRCFVVDERGEPVSPSAVTGLIARREVARELGRGRDASEIAVVHNVITSRAVPELLAELGVRAVRTRVGHSYIKAEMASHEAIFGGEHSAHFYFRDFFFADTGMLAAMHVLAALGESSGTLSELMAEYSRGYVASGEINSVVDDVAESTERVLEWAQGQGVTVDRLDGATVTHEGDDLWWFSLRPSNTEPLLRLNVEARSTETMEWVRDQVLAIIRGEEPVGREVPAGAPADGVAAMPHTPLAMEQWARELLRCPVGHHELVDALSDEGTPVLRCAEDCGGAGVRREYPVEAGIPVLLADEARLVEA